MKLYVGNLSYSLNEDSIHDLFVPFGEVESVKLIMDRETGRSRGFAFVEMPNKDEALKAMGELARKEIDGRALVVNEARPQERR
ncbi:MAG: RNA-binding protein [Leptospiraceae bacterium]|nr:RNA-binding protein [Leptospiraceae bacterium]MCB1316489.1 RNA-binding protein [Leptospiraceae bacterium]MCB1323557.1 RNA-binding protein [Leptospiraceae bacterium]